MTQTLYSGLNGKNITLAVTGGIAAYKSCELVRLLIKSGAHVRVCMTQAALHFVGSLTFAALSGNSVVVEPLDGSMQHIALTRDCDLLLVAPATADMIAKVASGVADDLVSSVILASRCPAVFCPAMNCNMWAKAATQRNVDQIKADGYAVLGPACGVLACGDSGAGRMIEPAEIVASVARMLSPQLLAGKRVVVTAGPTYEAIDPVRGITNLSSGKQGYAVAQAAFEAGAQVTLISGPTALEAPIGIETHHVVSGEQMREHAMKACEKADVFVSVAAVADWRLEAVSDHKIKKTGEPPQLKLVENPDILADVAKAYPALYCVGFAAETDDILENARAKRVKKNVRMIVANNAAKAIGSGKNEAWIVTATSEAATGAMSKQALAARIIKAVAADLA